MKVKEIESNEEMLEKLQEFCKQNNLNIKHYEVEEEDPINAYKWNIKLVKGRPKQ